MSTHGSMEDADEALFLQLCDALVQNPAVAAAPGALVNLVHGVHATSAAIVALPRSQDTRGTRGSSLSDPVGADVGHKRWQRQIRLQTVEAEQRLRDLAVQHGVCEAENKRLKLLYRSLVSRCKQAEFQQRMVEITRHVPRTPLLLPDCCSQVSFSELPPSSCWDATWVSRIMRLRPQDFLVLRRQWIQQSAVLLPQAVIFGPESHAYIRLQEMYNRHRDLVQALVTLAPSVWLESSQFEMDALRPIQMPSAEWLKDMLVREVGKDTPALSRLVALGQQYDDATTVLHDEYCLLLQRYDSLGQAMDLRQLNTVTGIDVDHALATGTSSLAFGAGTRGSPPLALSCLRLGGGSLAHYMEMLQQLDDTATLLLANTNGYKSELLKYNNGISLGFDPACISFHLMMYPLATTIVDFTPGLLLLSRDAHDAATAAAVAAELGLADPRR